jgi:ornithine decarboxylase
VRTDHQAGFRLPASWPTALHPRVLAGLDLPTPFLACDLDAVADRYLRFTKELPGVDVHYAMKCNPSEEVLRTLAAYGSGFEIASLGELRMLQAIGVDPAEVLYSNPIKPPAHIVEAHRAGLWRFSFDGEGELRKLARYAPGSAVYVRLGVDDSTSTFPLSRKFGADEHEAHALLLLARELGLRPYGVTFHVGSQCGSTAAWRQAVASAGRLMRALLADGVRLEMLDVGGGFPARYGDRVPSLADIAGTLQPALTELLPYRPPVLAAEPGRHLVAESAVLVAGVLGREVRGHEQWVYLDVGAYNGLMETQQTANRWRYPLWTSRADHVDVPHEAFTVTGPSCDSSDTMFLGVALPSTIEVGDHVYIGSTGAYTLSYASAFNGFPPPEPVFVGGVAAVRGIDDAPVFVGGLEAVRGIADAPLG